MNSTFDQLQAAGTGVSRRSVASFRESEIIANSGVRADTTAVAWNGQATSYPVDG